MIPFFVRLFFVLVLLIGLLSCSESSTYKNFVKENQSEIKPDQTGYDIEVAFMDSSLTKAILKAKKSRIYQERMETFLDDNIMVEFFSKDGKKRVSLLTADSAKIDDRTKDMTAWGKVIVIADSSGTVLETKLLMWDNKNQKLYSTEFVTITSPNEKLQGYGFESDQNLSNYKIFKVSGVQK
ncbi:MAG: LPS export ABC transporter periplasmic protein LptC [Candidatus Kapabacteria bacterium]|nr:LPS export ABC transporter periplasmic protein LptC [Candidatus Kapabacteria bacterium]